MNSKAPWVDRPNDHDHFTKEHVAGFLRQHRTGVDNHGRLALLQIVGQYQPVSVLDIACGTAVNYEVFRNFKLDCDYTGLDRTQQFLDHASELYGEDDNFTAVHGFVQDLPFEDGSKDVVIVRHILEHLPPDEVELVIREAYRVASKELVVVFFLEPHGGPEHTIEERQSGDLDGVTHYWNTYSNIRMMQLFASLGGRIERHSVVTPGAAHHDSIVRIIK